MLDFQRVNFNPQVGVCFFCLFFLVMTDERIPQRQRTDCPVQPVWRYNNSFSRCLYKEC